MNNNRSRGGFARPVADHRPAGNDIRFGMTRNDGEVGGNPGNGGNNGGCVHGCGCNPPQKPCRDCNAMLRRIMKLDFSIQEIVLYLDAYPDCCEALGLYRRLCRERAQAVAEYEEKCGPLTCRGNDECASWDWVKTPWPWQMDEPGDKGESRCGCRRNG